MKFSGIGDRVPVVIIHTFASRYSPNFEEEEEAQAAIASVVVSGGQALCTSLICSLALLFSF